MVGQFSLLELPSEPFHLKTIDWRARETNFSRKASKLWKKNPKPDGNFQTFCSRISMETSNQLWPIDISHRKVRLWSLHLRPVNCEFCLTTPPSSLYSSLIFWNDYVVWNKINCRQWVDFFQSRFLIILPHSIFMIEILNRFCQLTIVRLIANNCLWIIWSPLSLVV